MIAEARCDWCGHTGTPVTEIGLVRSATGDRPRCTDRDACRARVTTQTVYPEMR